MSQSTLSAQLANMVPTDTEAAAVATLSSAWATYFASAAAGVVPYTGDPGNIAKGAMQAALTGMSAPGAGLASLQAGVLAYWGAIAGAAATFFPGALSVTPPPGVAALAATLAPVMIANQAGNLSLHDAADAIATAMHTSNLGGMAVFPPPINTVPIL